VHLTLTPTHRTALHLPAVPLGRLPLPAVLLTAVYLLALVVAATAPREQALAGLVVLAGLTARFVARRRRPSTSVVPAATADAAPAPLDPQHAVA